MKESQKLLESLQQNLNEEEKQELEDAKQALKNPDLKGDERTEYQHDVARLTNKENLTEEEKSIYDYTEEEIEAMNLGQMVSLYTRICDESDYYADDILDELNKNNCLNTENFRNMLKETIEYMNFNN